MFEAADELLLLPLLVLLSLQLRVLRSRRDEEAGCDESGHGILRGSSLSVPLAAATAGRCGVRGGLATSL